MGVDSPIDTYVDVYREDNGNLIHECGYDNDNCYAWGETFVMNPTESGTYYLVFNVYDSYVGDSDCHVDIITLDNIKNMNDIFDNAEDTLRKLIPNAELVRENIITMTNCNVLYMPKHTA